jgi:hypothetical protein
MHTSAPRDGNRKKYMCRDYNILKSALCAATVIWGAAAQVTACPDINRPAQQAVSTTGQDLYSPNVYSVIAGGDQQLTACGFQFSGQVISSPDFEFQLDGLEAYNRLNIRVESSCDTVLLVSDSRGAWLYNDDSIGLNPSVDIQSPSSGIYDVWVGTYGSSNCQSSLILETF